jgi:modulator of FtsH protease
MEFNMQDVYNTHSTQVLSQSDVSKVLRNTYFLLGLTLAFSAICAGGAMVVGIGHEPYRGGPDLVCPA